MSKISDDTFFMDLRNRNTGMRLKRNYSDYNTFLLEKGFYEGCYDIEIIEYEPKGLPKSLSQKEGFRD